MIGKVVSHYRILEHIGEGGMGTVYLAMDTKLHRRVALKFLRDELTRDEERRDRFVREARAAGAIEHPNIAAIHDIDEMDGHTFIVMEYVEGRSLREVIRPGGISIEECLAITIPITEALAKAHEHGVVHRDVKPDNILVADDGYPKLVDFGLAKLLEPPSISQSLEETTQYRTREGYILGTAAYMSPEQVRGEEVDERTDIFAMGVVFYEMLTGRSPFLRETAIESMNATLNENPPPAGLPEPDRVLETALAKEPSRRYPSMKELARDLNDLRVVRPDRPLVRAWIAVAVGILAAAAIFGYYLLNLDGARPGVGLSGRPSVAILYFEDNSGEEEIRWLSKGLPSMVLTDLAQIPGLDVVSSQRVHEILNQVGAANVESIDRRLAAEVARRSGAGAVVVGSIFKVGDEIRIDVQVEDLDSGRVISADSVRGTEIFPLVDELTGRIRTGLRVPDDGTNRPLADISTHSVEAYRLYVEGRDAAASVREADARRLYEEAVRRDPGFTMAHFELSRLLRQWDVALADAHRERALANLDRLSERERLVVESRYLQQDDPARAIGLAELLIASYPDETRGYRTLSLAYRRLGDTEKALSALERGVQANPASGSLYNFLGYELLLYNDRPTEALEAFRSYEQLDPGEANPYDSQGEAYLLLGQTERAIERFDRALEIDPSFASVRYTRIWANAMLGHYDDVLEELPVFTEQALRDRFLPQYQNFLHACVLSRVGRCAEAEEETARGMQAAGKRSDVGGRIELTLLTAWFALERGRHVVAVEEAQRALDETPEMTNPGWSRNLTLVGHLLAGAAEARRGRLGAAGTHLDAVVDLRDPNDTAHTFWYHALQGELALAQGDASGAKKAFLAIEPSERTFFNRRIWPQTMYANNLPFRDGVARAELALGDRAAAIEAYRALLVAEKRPYWRSWLEPRHVLELARLLDQAGNKAEARLEYERFLKLWKKADTDLAEIEEARAYVSAMEEAE